MNLWHLQVSYEISTVTLWYLHNYSICKFATKYLLNHYGTYTYMVSTTLLQDIYNIYDLYDDYVLYKNLQSLLMQEENQGSVKDLKNAKRIYTANIKCEAPSSRQ